MDHCSNEEGLDGSHCAAASHSHTVCLSAGRLDLHAQRASFFFLVSCGCIYLENGGQEHSDLHRICHSFRFPGRPGWEDVLDARGVKPQTRVRSATLASVIHTCWSPAQKQGYEGVRLSSSNVFVLGKLQLRFHLKYINGLPPGTPVLFRQRPEGKLARKTLQETGGLA